MPNQFKLAEAYAELKLRGRSRFHADLRNVRGSLQRTQKHMDDMAKVARRMLMVGGAAFGLAVRQAMNFEHAMARVAALTGATGQQFARLTAQARELGATTQYTASQSAQAMSAFALAGFDVNKIMASMEPTLNLAAAGQLEIGQAADIAAKIMAGMKMEAKDLGHATDVLAKAFTTANTDLVQLGEAMKYVGPVGKTAGKELEELVAVIQVLSNVGLQSTMAGTGLRTILSRLAKEGKEVQKVFGDLNVPIKAASGYIRPLADIIDDFNKALETQGRQADATGMAMMAFGDRAGPAFAALLGEGGAAIRKYEKALRDADGTAQRIAKTQMDTLKGSTIALKSAIESLAISVGEIYGPALRSLADDLRDVASESAKMDNVVKRNIATWSEFGLQAGLATIAGAKLLGVIAKLGGGAGVAIAGGAAAVGLYGTAASRTARHRREGVGFGEQMWDEALRMTEQGVSLVSGSHAQRLRQQAAVARATTRASTAALLAGTTEETPLAERHKLEVAAMKEAEKSVKQFTEALNKAEMGLRGTTAGRAEAMGFGPVGVGFFRAMMHGEETEAQQNVIEARSKLASAQARLAEHEQRAAAIGLQRLGGFLAPPAPQAPPRRTMRGAFGEAWQGAAGFMGIVSAGIERQQRAQFADMDAMRMAREAEAGPRMMAEIDLQEKVADLRERFAKRRTRVERQYRESLSQMAMAGGGAVGFAGTVARLQAAVSEGERQQIRLLENLNNGIQDLHATQKEALEELKEGREQRWPE